MISAVTAEPLSTSSVALSDYRHRHVPGEHGMLQDSTPPAAKNSSASDNGRFPQEGRKPAPPEPEQPRRDQSAMFAAAVIAGALSPKPTTMEELILRIGTSPIPEESAARLKDLLA